MAFLAEAEAYPLDQADVAIFPLRRFNGFLWHIGERPFYGVALDCNFLRIDIVGFFVLRSDQQIPLPQAHQQHPFLVGVIDVPGNGRRIIEFNNAEFNGLPRGFFSCVGLLAREATDCQQEKSAQDNEPEMTKASRHWEAALPAVPPKRVSAVLRRRSWLACSLIASVSSNAFLRAREAALLPGVAAGGIEHHPQIHKINRVYDRSR